VIEDNADLDEESESENQGKGELDIREAIVTLTILFPSSVVNNFESSELNQLYVRRL
jgi:hypothetical protein